MQQYSVVESDFLKISDTKFYCDGDVSISISQRIKSIQKNE